MKTLLGRCSDACREATGAQSGYVALLSKDGAENEVVFLESGGLPCDVDLALPMPIRGLRSEAHRLSETVYDNDFHHSEWQQFLPEGHVALEKRLVRAIANRRHGRWPAGFGQQAPGVFRQ